MVDRIQLGTTRKEDEKEVLTRKQYESSYVDFFSQTLGMPTLEEQTGIDVTAPKIGGDSSTKDTSDGNEDSQANLERDLLGALGGDSGALGGDIKFGEDAADFNFTQKYDTYGDFLKQQPGQHDRVEMFSEVFDPLTRGDFKDIKPGALFDSGIKNVQQIPGAVDQTAKDLQQTGLKATAEKNKEKVVGSLMGVVGGIPGSIAGGFINGTTTTNAFGKASFRPSGALGFVADMVHSKQYQDMAQIRAATAADASATGFAMAIGGFGITRAPGSGSYTGNMRGLSHVQVKTLESLNKGYLPSSYNMQKETGTSLADAGYVSGRLSTGGYYKDNGTYMTATGQTAAFGMEADAKALGEKYGISDVETVRGILANARNGRGTVSGLMAAEKARIDKAAADKAAADKAAADKAAADKAAADRAAAQKRATDEINRRRQQEYGRDDSGGGYDFGDTGQTGATGGTADYGGASAGARGFADGGQVGMAVGGQMAAGMAPSGFIGAPPSQVSEAESVADNVNTQKQEGTFIINAAAVEFAGESDIMKMLKDAQKEAVRRGITVDNPERSAKLIDVAVSRGEVTVAPHLVKIIGEDRLTKINNRGKPEVKERIEENGQQAVGAAEGGFLGFIDSINPFSSSEEETPQQGFATVPVKPVEAQPVPAGRELEGDVGEAEYDAPMSEYGDVPKSLKEAASQFGAKVRTRSNIKDFMSDLSDVDALALLIMSETVSNRDPVDDMKAIGQVVVNRANSNYRNFKKQNTIKDVILSQTKGGAFEFAGVDKTPFNRILKDIKQGKADRGLAKAYSAANDVLSGEMEAEPIVSPNTLYYTLPKAQSQWMRKSPDLQLSTKFGKHEFYEVR
jgi:hypothetical protein